MRCRPALHLFAALLALVTGLSSPLRALAHGLAHEHAHEQEAPAVAHRASHAPTAPAEAVVTADSPAGGLHAPLHAQCTAIVHLPVGLLPEPPACFPAADVPRAVPPGIQPVLGFPPQERGSPPDQPRAPPLG